MVESSSLIQFIQTRDNFHPSPCAAHNARLVRLLALALSHDEVDIPSIKRYHDMYIYIFSQLQHRRCLSTRSSDSLTSPFLRGMIRPWLRDVILGLKCPVMAW